MVIDEINSIIRKFRQQMNNSTKYLSEAEKVRLKLLEDEIFMLNNKVTRTLKKRDRLRQEVKRINESTSATEIKWNTLIH